MTELKGHYSLRVDVPKNITGPPPNGNTTSNNFCAQATNLSGTSAQLTNKANDWYLYASIHAHEAIHKAHLLPALNAIAAQIDALVSGMTEQDYGQDANAVKAVMKTDLLQIESEALNLWLQEYATRWPQDHGTNSNGPAYTAESAANQPMKQSICAYAKANSWPNCAACPP